MWSASAVVQAIIEKAESELVLSPGGGWVEKAKGKGRGHWGHKGRPGKRGGSLPSKGTAIAVEVVMGVKYNKARLKTDVESIRSLMDTYKEPVDTKVRVVESTEGFLASGYYAEEGAIGVDAAGKDVVAPQLTLGEYHAVGPGVYDVFRHEYGHHIFDSLPRSKREEFNDLYGRPSRESGIWWDVDVSVLATRNNWEGFCESFAAYTSPKYRPGKLPKPLEDFMATIGPAKVKSDFTIDQIKFQLGITTKGE